MFDLSIEPLSDDIRQSYRALLPHQVEQGFNFVDWKFGETPAGPGMFSVARNDGEIVGLSAYLNLPFRLGDALGQSYQAIDSIVAPAAQGKGLFARLARSFGDDMAEEADLIWGFPNANAAPIWFRRLGWTRHGYAPFLVKPLRSGYLLRRFGLPIDFRASLLRDRGATTVRHLDDRVDELWLRFSRTIGAAVERDRRYLEWRLFLAPNRNYRVAFESGNDGGALVASTISEKHGGRIGYLMEAFGGSTTLKQVLRSEVGRMIEDGAEVALAWCYPWSPNYSVLRNAGFVPLPERFRPAEIHVGSRSYSSAAEGTNDVKSWYLSYLDSDTN